MRTHSLLLQDSTAPGFDALLRLVQHHLPSPVAAGWLVPAVQVGAGSPPLQTAVNYAPGMHVPLRVKQLLVDVPIDQKAARTAKKTLRKEGRVASKAEKERRLESSKQKAVDKQSVRTGRPQI
jgi:hypothetical protein